MKTISRLVAKTMFYRQLFVFVNQWKMGRMLRTNQHIDAELRDNDRSQRRLSLDPKFLFSVSLSTICWRRQICQSSRIISSNTRKLFILIWHFLLNWRNNSSIWRCSTVSLPKRNWTWEILFDKQMLLQVIFVC